MKKRGESRTRSGLAVLLWLAVFCLAIVPALAQAETDTDSDGLPDSVEQAGLTVNGAFYPPCVTGSVRNTCLSYTTKDVFAIILRAQTGSLFPTDPLAFMEASEPTWGVHYLTQNTTVADQTGTVNGRTVYSDASMTQHALRFTEDNVSTLSSGNLLGLTTWGTPNGYDDSKIYSLRLKQWFTETSTASGITKVCYSTTASPLTPSNKTTQCAAPANSTFMTNLQNIYLESIIGHEAGHQMELTAAYNATYGYHYAASTSPTEMMQYVYYTSKSGTLTWYIGDRYESTDSPALRP
ncbi:MAG: hypothetical protein WAN11_03565 [Syntrophobacteraceae bacterium]